MGAKIGVLGLIISFLPYLRSVMVRFPFCSFGTEHFLLKNVIITFNIGTTTLKTISKITKKNENNKEDDCKYEHNKDKDNRDH